jgi:L-lactate dehydrogenase (cytochrome)
MEIYFDGGLRDGSDELKALCLGATTVGVWRPFLYALAAYGLERMEKCVDSKYECFECDFDVGDADLR